MRERPYHVHYAAYGSNIDAQRFACYLVGGRPQFATSNPHEDPGDPGARCPEPPTESIGAHVAGSVNYRGNAKRWGHGGVAFFDPPPQNEDPTKHLVPVRLHRITFEQFSDVFAQENGQSKNELGATDEMLARFLVDCDWQHADADPLGPLAHRQLLSTWYGRVILLGRRSDEPVLTFTHDPTNALSLNAPHESYMKTIRRGLRQIGIAAT